MIYSVNFMDLTEKISPLANPQCLINDSSIWGAINIEFESLDVYTMKMQ